MDTKAAVDIDSKQAYEELQQTICKTGKVPDNAAHDCGAWLYVRMKVLNKEDQAEIYKLFIKRVNEAGMTTVSYDDEEPEGPPIKVAAPGRRWIGFMYEDDPTAPLDYDYYNMVVFYTMHWRYSGAFRKLL